MTKINWRVYERDHIYPQTISAYLDLMHLKESPKYPYFAKYYEVMSFIDDYFWWARDKGPLEKSFRGWIKKWTQRPATLKALVNSFQKVRRQMMIILPGLKQKKIIKKLSNQEIFKIYQQARGLFWDNIQYSEYPVDLFDDFIDKIFRERLMENGRIDINETDWIKLMKPAYVSVVLQYKKSLLDLSLKTKIIPAKINKIADDFYWIMMSWDGSHELSIKQVWADLKELKRKSRRARQRELIEIDRSVKTEKIERRALIKKYGLVQKKIAPYFNLLDTFAKLHDWRKEAQMRDNQVILWALREMSRRFKINYQSLLHYLNHEIKDLCLSGKRISSAELKKRQQGFTLVVRRGKIRQYFGKSARTVLKTLVLDVLRADKKRIITGVPVCRGRVRGRALVVKSAREAIKKIKKGMILITSMTTVDYVPAMRYASAIVTDDGGLTCHAAIVSRELGIPCVVGTKIATQVLKDGDRVEVDANRGIVRKL